MITTTKPPLEEAYLEHFGIFGMRWGIRKDRTSGGLDRKPLPGMVVDSSLHKATRNGAIEVAEFMSDRYGFKIRAIESFPPGDIGWANNHMGNVKITPGQRTGIIHARPGDLTSILKTAEKQGWVGKNCGDSRGLFMHEASHAFFHADLLRIPISGKEVKAFGGHSVALDKAMDASLKEANKKGIPPKDFTKAVSGYAKSSNVQEEIEAELFTQYHLSPNPPSFVKVWGQTVHKELGIDATPYREGGVKRG